MTTYSPQGKPRPVITGRYRQLVTAPSVRTAQPPSKGRNPACSECDELIGLVEKVASLEAWRMITSTDLKAVLEVIQQAKVLMALSLSGGVLSLVSLVLTVLSLIERNY